MKLSQNAYKHLKSLFEHYGGGLETVAAGAVLYSSQNQAGQIVLLEQGKARILDADKTFGSQTIIQCDAPILFGLSSFIDSAFNEEIRAATDCSSLSLNIANLSETEHDWFRSLLGNALDESEWSFLYQVLKTNFKENFPTLKGGQELGLSCQLIKSLDGFAPSSSGEDNEALIPVYVDQEKNGFVYGQILTYEILKLSFSSGSLPRIVGCKVSQSNPQAANQSRLSESKADKEQSSIANSTEATLPSSVQESADDSKQYLYLNNVEIIRASNRRDCFFACLMMINNYFNLPSRRDAISRSADFLDSKNDNWLNDMQAILDKFGLAVRIARSDTKRPLNIPVPSIWISQDGFCKFIVKRDTRNLIFADPLSGIQKINHSEAFDLFNTTPEIMAVDIGLHTPTKKFSVAWLIPYVMRHRVQLIEVFSASFLNQIFALATPLLFQQIIDRVISKGASDALYPLAALMLACALLEVTFSSLRTFQFVEISNRVDIGVGSAIVARLLRLNARFFDSRPVGELSSRLGELTNIRNFLTGTALTVVLDALFSLLYFSVMLFYSVTLTIIILLTVPLLMLVTVGLTPITQRLIRRRAEAASRTQSLLVEMLGGIQTIKLQNAELTSRKQWEDRHLKTINQGFKAILANTGSSNAVQLINKISNILVIGVGAYLVLENKLTLGQLIAFRIIAGYVTQPMIRLASSWKNFQEMSLSLERVGDIVNQSLEVQENEENSIIIPELKGKLELDCVSYEYSSSAPPVLSSVSINIPAGSFTGFVGQSGCGKSTLLKLIPRLYRPSRGRVLVDDYDIAKVDLYALRSQIGFVPQDCMLFEGTIFSNISLGDPNSSSEEVVKVAKLACAHEFIMGLPFGYSTPIGEKGAGLSGGQRQRIALARMLLEKPRLVILDEATSALDVDTEKQVVKNLRQHFKDTTLLMITHRISSLAEADQIIVMHSGRVDSTGTHEDLMAARGRYYALYRSQFGE